MILVNRSKRNLTFATFPAKLHSSTDIFEIGLLLPVRRTSADTGHLPAMEKLSGLSEHLLG